MTLADEVTRAQEKAREANRAEQEERRAKTLESAAERFRALFEQDADSVTWFGEDVEQSHARDWPKRVPVIVEHDGIRLGYAPDRSGHYELRALITCATCGREYLGDAIYSYSGDVRDSAIACLARALAPNAWKAHECLPNVLAPVQRAITSAARTLGVSDAEVIAEAMRKGTS